MTMPQASAQIPAPTTTAAPNGQPRALVLSKTMSTPSPGPPHLLWPVSRREFYRTIWVAMLPAFAWAAVVFGVRVIAMLIGCVLATTLVHILLKRIIRWERARSLVYQHSLVTVMVLVALAHPLWPIWVTVVMAVLIPLILAGLGGPGRERVHVAVILVLAIQFAVMPRLIGRTYAGGIGGTGGNALLARDRLVMGDIREQQTALFYAWPSSRDLAGADAVKVPLPAQAAAQTLDDLSRLMAQGRGEALAMGLLPADAAAFRTTFDDAFQRTLPGLDLEVAGAAAGRIGTISLIGIVMAGLYMAYRFILRPRSVAVFLAAFAVTTIAVAFWPSAIARIGAIGVWNLVKTFPGEIGTLINILLLNSDAPFAAVFILALPGTEPLTARGRRIFLALAGVLAAVLHRMDPTLTAATLALCVLMPFARLFDNLFGKRSWLNTRR